MTFPGYETTVPGYWRQNYGVNSELAQREWNEFLRSRDTFIQQLMGSHSVMQTGQPSIVPSPAMMQQQEQAPPDTELLGQARAWGIPEEAAAQMPRDQLQALIAQYRNERRPADGVFSGAQDLQAMFVLGMGEAVTGGLKRLPFVGEWFARNEALQKADTWLNEAEEAVRATIPNREQWAASTAEVGGQVAGLWYPGVGAWNLAGKIGRIIPMAGPLASPIVRGAAQGAASTWALEGGGEDAALMTDLGALLGIAGPVAGPILRKVAPEIAMMRSRVSQAFGRTVKAEAVQLGPVQRIQQYGAPLGPHTADMELPVNIPHTPEFELSKVIQDPLTDEATRQSATTLLRDLQGSRSARGTTVARDVSGMEISLGQSASLAQPASVERIVAAAIKSPTTGKIYQGQLHSDALDAAFRAGDEIDAMVPDEFAGYFTSTNRFVSDAEAEIIAARAEQITSRVDPADRLHASQVNMEAADNIAAQMSKQAMATESSSLPDLARATNLDEASLAVATHIDNPGGTNVIPGIVDPTRFASTLEKIPFVRFAKRGNRLDAITSDQPITDDMLGQYEQHGMFAGQVGYTQDGTSIRILDIQGSMARIKPLYGQTEVMVPVESIMPSPVSGGVIENTALYQDFQQYVSRQVAEAQSAMGSVITPELEAVMRTQNLAHWTENFLDDLGFVQPGDRARLKQYFAEQYVNDFRALAPEEMALQSYAHVAANNAALEHPLTPIASLTEAAETKGYLALPDGQGGWNIANNVPDAFGTGGAVQIHFDTIEAAQEFLRKHHRSVPDLTPPGEVPPELASGLPRAGMNEPSLANDRVDADLDSATDDLIDAVRREGDEALANDLTSRLQLARAAGRTGDIRQLYDYGLSKFQPMRNRMLAIERKLLDAGYPEVRPFQHFDNISVGMDKTHNFSNPHLARWTDITNVFDDAKMLRTGRVTELWAIEDPVLRATKAAQSGFNEKQIAAFGEMDKFFDDVLADLSTWLGNAEAFVAANPASSMKKLLTFVRTRQFAGLGADKPFDFGDVNSSTVPVLEELKRAHVDLRELDARNLGNLFVRSHGFNAFTKNAWETAEAEFKMIAKIGESRPGAANGEFSPVSAIMQNWMKLVRHGYQPGADVWLDVMHSVASFMVPGMTKAQVRSIFNAGLTNTHRALLGLRPDVMFRDSIQLFLALPRAGTDLLEVIGRYSTGSNEVKGAMWDRAIKKAGVQIGKPRIAQPGTFEDPLVYVEDLEQVGAVGELIPQPPVSKRYKMLQDVADWVHDKTPDNLRHISGTVLDPLFLYTKQGERMRLFVFTAGDQRAARAVGSYRQHGDFDKLMGESGARTFEPGVGKKFKEYVASGNDDEAAAFMGRQLADATQFRYGVANTPEIARSTFGKVGMQLGSFSTQFYQYSKESVRYGSGMDKAKWWGMMGAVYGSLKYAKHKTGWNFDKWQFYQSLVFTGGPWFGVLADLQEGSSALSQMAIRGDQPGGEYLAQRAGALGVAGRTIAGMVNPVAGGMRTASSILAAQQSPTPGEATARAVITGERDASMDWREMIGEHILRQPSIESLVPSSSPVRGNQMSMAVVPIAAADTLPSGPATVDIQRWSDRRYSTQRTDITPPGESWRQYEDSVAGMPRESFTDTAIVRSLDELEPEARNRIHALQQVAAAQGIQLDVAETARSQKRQEYLFAQGRNPAVPGPIVTWTLTSAHTGGRAVDFIVNGDITGKDPGYRWLQEMAEQLGLKTLGRMDPGHVSVPASGARSGNVGSGGGGFQ